MFYSLAMVKIFFIFLNFLKFGKTFKLPPNNASNVIYDMDLTEDEYNAYSGNDILDFDHVIPNVTAFKWENGVIPFEFNEEKPFDDKFKKIIMSVIDHLNRELSGCIEIRYLTTYF